MTDAAYKEAPAPLQAAEPRARRLRPPMRIADDAGSKQEWAAFWQELERSRRYMLSFSLVCISARAAGPGAPTRPDVAAAIQVLVRRIDPVWSDAGAVFVLLPETTRAGASQFVSRLAASAPEIAQESAISVATFPDDAVTSDGLLDVIARSGLVSERPAREESPYDHAAEPLFTRLLNLCRGAGASAGPHDAPAEQAP